MARNEPLHLPHLDQSFPCEPEEDFHLCFPETILNSDNKNIYFIRNFMILSGFVAVCGNQVGVAKKIIIKKLGMLQGKPLS